MNAQAFYIYHSYADALDGLTDAEVGRLLRALLQYSATGEVPDLRGNERFVFPLMRGQIDRDKAAYERKCQARAAAGKKGADARWQTMANDGNAINRMAKMAKEKEKEKEKKKENEKEKKKENEQIKETPAIAGEKKSAVRFIPPTLEEVEAYQQEKRLLLVDAGYFIDYYAAQDWKLSNGQPLKDWKAAFRNWHRREEEQNAQRSTVSRNNLRSATLRKRPGGTDFSDVVEDML